jgi:hypothetical protein
LFLFSFSFSISVPFSTYFYFFISLVMSRLLFFVVPSTAASKENTIASDNWSPTATGRRCRNTAESL